MSSGVPAYYSQTHADELGYCTYTIEETGQPGQVTHVNCTPVNDSGDLKLVGTVRSPEGYISRTPGRRKIDSLNADFNPPDPPPFTWKLPDEDSVTVKPAK